MTGTLACFNCEKTEGVQRYSFDLDLPTVEGCSYCIFALSMGDDELLKALRPRRSKRRRKAGDD